MAVANWPAAKPTAAAASISMTARDTGHGRASTAAITAGTTTDAPSHTGGSERRAKYSSTPAPSSTGSQSMKRPRSAACHASSHLVNICCTHRRLTTLPLQPVNARAIAWMRRLTMGFAALNPIGGQA